MEFTKIHEMRVGFRIDAGRGGTIYIEVPKS